MPPVLTPFYGYNRPGAKPSQGVILNWWRQGMMGGAKAHFDGIVAFSQTDFTEDLKKITVPVLVMHGDEDLSFAKTPSGNAGLRVRLGGLAARGTARCGSRKGSRHAGFAPCVRPLRTEASVEQRPIHRAGPRHKRRLSDCKHWGVGAPGGTRTPGIRLRRRRPWPVPART